MLVRTDRVTPEPYDKRITTCDVCGADSTGLVPCDSCGKDICLSHMLNVQLRVRKERRDFFDGVTGKDNQYCGHDRNLCFDCMIDSVERTVVFYAGQGND